MKIAIISDTHDNIENTEKAIEIFKQKKVSSIIHCGDFCAPFMMIILDKAEIPIDCVFGNIDDRFGTTRKADSSKNIKLHGDIAEIEIDNKKIAVTHFPNFADALAFTGKYDLVFHGHTHKKRDEKINNTLIVNPGTLAGINNPATFAIYDTETNEVEFFDLK